MNEIWIIVTEGCEGCRIAINLVNKAVKEYNIIPTAKKSIEITNIKTIDHLNKQYIEFIKKHNINDYPTIMFIKDKNVMSIHTGTIPVSKIISEIKLWFN